MEDVERQEEVQAEEAEEKSSVPKRKKRHRRRRRISGVKLVTLWISVLVMLAFCVVMVSPLRGCTVSDGDFIKKTVAQKTAFDNAGISADNAESVTTEMIKLDEGMCYKINFSHGDAEYSYIVSADSGKIIVSRSSLKQTK